MLQIELHVEYMKAQKKIGQLLYKLGKQTKEKKVYKEEEENMRARINELVERHVSVRKRKSNTQRQI